ncbi:MAG TPA: cupin domain-containing protein [Candidatus Limnocylindrales bacterium]|nr:cupin domain-containing protein [Candidatus Limnocylindrales bacterium]
MSDDTRQPLRSGDEGGAQSRVRKPWGEERIWVHTDQYAGKVLTIEAGKRLSLQYHEAKDEAILVLSGRLRLHLEDAGGRMREIDLEPGESRRIPVGRRHRFEALERTELIEVSGPQLDDVVRVEDDFGREGTNTP